MVVLVTAGGLALALLAWGARVGAAGWHRRRRRAAFASRARSGDGEEPGRAIRVSATESIEREGMGGACACGGPWREVDRATLQYDGRPMAVATRRCLLCAGERVFYFYIG
jgi:hypothetical protein